MLALQNANEIKTTAEYYRRGLLLGLDLMAETMAWLDQGLLTEDVPEIALIEASLCGSHGPIAVADWLGQLPGEFDQPTVARRLLRGMLTLIDRYPARILEVTRWIYQMALDDEWPGLEGENGMWSFWDYYDMAVDGIHGDPEVIRKDIRAFLLRAALLVEVALFQQWANASFPNRGSGEWECEYGAWDKLYAAVLGFVAAHPFSDWCQEEIQAVLCALARDNESGEIADALEEYSLDLLPPLTKAAIEFGERDARWQLAMVLGRIEARGYEPEQMLLKLAHDEDEYVRRRALDSLTRIGSPAVEDLAIEMWEREDPHQEWSRMMVLSCLQKIGSPRLEPLLSDAEQDTRPHLRATAERIRSEKISEDNDA